LRLQGEAILQAGASLLLRELLRLERANNLNHVPKMKNLTCLIVIAAFAAGCTYTARITNAKKFAPVETRLAKRVTLGIAPMSEDRLLSAAVNKVKQDASITECKDNFRSGTGWTPDYICQLSRDTKYKAAGQNFFITFPGFIVFTHALVGYKYTADITTHSAIADANAKPISQTDIKTPIEFRHCSFARGAAAGCVGWLTPGYGAAAIIPGAIFASSYDKRATLEFTEKAENIYASYVASKILEQIGQSQSSRTTALEPQTFPLGDESVEVASAGEYAVYVMKVDGNQISVPEVSVKELPASVRQTLDAMSSARVTPNQDSLEQVLVSLGLSSGDYFGQLERAEVFTQVDEHIIKLQQAE
jgi:hypothetical protein